jgi:hypothetical protein
MKKVSNFFLTCVSFCSPYHQVGILNDGQNNMSGSRISSGVIGANESLMQNENSICPQDLSNVEFEALNQPSKDSWCIRQSPKVCQETISNDLFFQRCPTYQCQPSNVATKPLPVTPNQNTVSTSSEPTSAPPPPSTSQVTPAPATQTSNEVPPSILLRRIETRACVLCQYATTNIDCFCITNQKKVDPCSKYNACRKPSGSPGEVCPQSQFNELQKECLNLRKQIQ